MQILLRGLGFIVIVMLITIPIANHIAKRRNTEIFGNGNAPLLVKSAKVLSKRTSPHPMTPTVSINYVLFELADGTRLEVPIKDAAVFASIIEGDKGTLKVRGNWFVGFERFVGNAPEQ